MTVKKKNVSRIQWYLYFIEKGCLRSINLKVSNSTILSHSGTSDKLVDEIDYPREGH